jgi:hypothetical protein
MLFRFDKHVRPKFTSIIITSTTTIKIKIIRITTTIMLYPIALGLINQIKLKVLGSGNMLRDPTKLWI